MNQVSATAAGAGAHPETRPMTANGFREAQRVLGGRDVMGRKRRVRRSLMAKLGLSNRAAGCLVASVTIMTAGTEAAFAANRPAEGHLYGTAFLGGGWTHPQGWGIWCTVLVGSRNDDRGGHELPIPPHVGGKGLLLGAEATERAVSLAVGIGKASGIREPHAEKRFRVGATPFSGGLGIKAVVVYAWADHGDLEQNRTYVGGEAEVALIVNLKVGVLTTLGGGPRRTLATFGVGVGF